MSTGSIGRSEVDALGNIPRALPGTQEISEERLNTLALRLFKDSRLDELKRGGFYEFVGPFMRGVIDAGLQESILDLLARLGSRKREGFQDFVRPFIEGDVNEKFRVRILETLAGVGIEEREGFQDFVRPFMEEIVDGNLQICVLEVLGARVPTEEREGLYDFLRPFIEEIVRGSLHVGNFEALVSCVCRERREGFYDFVRPFIKEVVGEDPGGHLLRILAGVRRGRREGFYDFVLPFISRLVRGDVQMVALEILAGVRKGEREGFYGFAKPFMEGVFNGDLQMVALEILAGIKKEEREEFCHFALPFMGRFISEDFQVCALNVLAKVERGEREGFCDFVRLFTEGGDKEDLQVHALAILVCVGKEERKEFCDFALPFMEGIVKGDLWVRALAILACVGKEERKEFFDLVYPFVERVVDGNDRVNVFIDIVRVWKEAGSGFLSGVVSYAEKDFHSFFRTLQRWRLSQKTVDVLLSFPEMGMQAKMRNPVFRVMITSFCSAEYARSFPSVELPRELSSEQTWRLQRAFTAPSSAVERKEALSLSPLCSARSVLAQIWLPLLYAPLIEIVALQDHSDTPLVFCTIAPNGLGDYFCARKWASIARKRYPTLPISVVVAFREGVEQSRLLSLEDEGEISTFISSGTFAFSSEGEAVIQGAAVLFQGPEGTLHTFFGQRRDCIVRKVTECDLEEIPGGRKQLLQESLFTFMGFGPRATGIITSLPKIGGLGSLEDVTLKDLLFGRRNESDYKGSTDLHSAYFSYGSKALHTIFISVCCANAQKDLVDIVCLQKDPVVIDLDRLRDLGFSGVELYERSSQTKDILLSESYVLHPGSAKKLRIINPYPLSREDLLCLIHHSGPLVGSTGDQSLSEAICLGKLPFYQCAKWKKCLYKALIGYAEDLHLGKLVKYFEAVGTFSGYRNDGTLLTDEKQLQELFALAGNPEVSEEMYILAGRIKSSSNFDYLLEAMLARDLLCTKHPELRVAEEEALQMVMSGYPIEEGIARVKRTQQNLGFRPISG